MENRQALLHDDRAFEQLALVQLGLLPNQSGWVDDQPTPEPTALQAALRQALKEALGRQPATPLQEGPCGDCIEFLPLRPMSAARGLCRGMDTHFEREEAER